MISQISQFLKLDKKLRMFVGLLHG